MRHLRVSEWQAMDFEYPLPVKILRQRLEDFVARYVRPCICARHRCVTEGGFSPAFVQDLKALGRSEALWILFCPA